MSAITYGRLLIEERPDGHEIARSIVACVRDEKEADVWLASFEPTAEPMGDGWGDPDDGTFWFVA